MTSFFKGEARLPKIFTSLVTLPANAIEQAPWDRFRTWTIEPTNCCNNEISAGTTNKYAPRAA